jgi:molybdate transport system regulatory protein
VNTIKGVITKIDVLDSFHRSEVSVKGKTVFSVLTLELKESFKENAKVFMLFKESDVIVAKGRHWLLSVENRVTCSVTKIKKGDVFVELELKTGFGALRSLIDRKAFDRLNLGLGDELNAFIKPSEISLMMEE